jgi:hypothetical protein
MDQERLMVKQEKTLSIVEKGVLRPGQLGLYKLIVEKIETNATLNIDEAEHIWLTKVHRDVRDGIPYRTDYYLLESSSWRDAQVPMDRWEIDFAVMNWLMKNIGLLVLRGYLKVIPMVELKKLGAN